MKPRRDQWFLVLIGLLAAMFFAAPLAAQTPPQCNQGPLAEADVVKLVVNNITEKRIVQTIETCGVSFSLTPESEKQLRDAGASDAVIAAIAKKTAEKKKEEALKSETPPPPKKPAEGAPSSGAVIGGIRGGGEGNNPPTAAQTIPKRIRVDGNVMSAKLLDQQRPKYPKKAKDKHISGTVRLHVVIAKDGAVMQIEVVSGHPLLIKATVDAVSQWKYQPTLLNGNPVEVDTIVEVVYTLTH